MASGTYHLLCFVGACLVAAVLATPHEHITHHPTHAPHVHHTHATHHPTHAPHEHPTHAPHPCHGANCPVSPDQVDIGIVNLELHYGDHLCLEILMINCNYHVTANDEIVCGTNGVEYVNHCKFAHSRCEYLHSNDSLEVANHGPCPPPTTTPLPGSSNTTAAPGGSTVAPSPTQNPVHGIIQGVFCQQHQNVTCPAGTTPPLCGSDGKIYANDCQLSTAKCTNPSLTTQPMTSCSLIG